MDTVEKNTKKIAEYSQNRIKEDEFHDQLALKEYVDPFTGSKQQSLLRLSGRKKRLQARLVSEPYRRFP